MPVGREYQRKKNNPYLLPHALYMRMIYLIRDYNRLKAEVESILHNSPPPPNGMPSGQNKIKLPTEEKAIKLALTEEEIEAIENALAEIPEFFRLPVMNNIMYGFRYPIGADERTFRRYKQIFVFYVAQNLKKI